MSDEIKDLVERLREEAERLSGHSIDRGSVDAGLSSNLATEAADSISRIAAERDAWEGRAQALRQELNDEGAACDARALAAEAERDRLREIVSRCAAALPNGAFVAPTASLEFMAQLPHEIELVCAALSSIKGRDG